MFKKSFGNLEEKRQINRTTEWWNFEFWRGTSLGYKFRWPG